MELNDIILWLRVIIGKSFNQSVKAMDEATARQDATQLIAKWQEAGIIA